MSWIEYAVKDVSYFWLSSGWGYRRPTVDNTHARIDMANHTVTVTIEEKESVVDLTYDEPNADMEGSGTDIEHSISD